MERSFYSCESMTELNEKVRAAIRSGEIVSGTCAKGRLHSGITHNDKGQRFPYFSQPNPSNCGDCQYLRAIQG